MHGTEEEPPYRLRADDEDIDLDNGISQAALALDEDERLPWLESADDEDEDGGVANARMIGFVLFGIVLLAAIVGALWFFSHNGGQSQVADGGIIKAPAQPYREAPKNTGGKTFAGTGDSAFAVSEGKSTAAKLGSTPAPAPVATAAPSKSSASEAGTAGGVGVQVGAYSSRVTAEAGWTRLSSGQAALKGLNHRIIEGTADIGTVFRLQAVMGDLAAANALCIRLKASGVACQVKR